MRFRGRQVLVILWLTMNLLLQFWDPVGSQVAPIMKMACPWPTKQASNIGERKSRPLPQGCLSGPLAWLGVTCWLFQRIVSGCGRSSCSYHVPIMFLSCSGGSSPRWNLAKTLVVKVPEDQAILYILLKYIEIPSISGLSVLIGSTLWLDYGSILIIWV